MFDEPKKSEPITCPWCDWSGILKDCHKEWYDSGDRAFRMLAGRRGWQWHCPKCKKVVKEHWLMMS